MVDWSKILSSIALCGGVGAIIDFVIGKKGQKKVRDSLETFWVRLSDVNVKTFARAEAQFAAQLMENILGRFFSLRRIFVLLIIGTIGCILWILIWLSRYDSHTNPALSINSLTDILQLTLLSGIVVMTSISLSITTILTKLSVRIITSHPGLNIGTYLLFVLIQIAFLLYGLESICSVGALIYDWASIPKNINGFAEEFWVNFKYLERNLANIQSIFRYVDTGLGGAVSFFSVIYVYAAGLLRLGIGLFFLFSVFFRPLHIFVLFIVERISETEKPFFTLVFSALGGMAEIIKKF